MKFILDKQKIINILEERELPDLAEIDDSADEDTFVKDAATLGAGAAAFLGSHLALKNGVGSSVKKIGDN